MKRITILQILLIGFASLATSSNGQEAILERKIDEMLLINSQIQTSLDSCKGDRVCRTLSSSADNRAEILRDLDTIDNAPEEKERGLRTVRKSILYDIELLDKQDLSRNEELARVQKLSEDFEKSSGKALSAVNTLGVINTARECPERC